MLHKNTVRSAVAANQGKTLAANSKRKARAAKAVATIEPLQLESGLKQWVLTRLTKDLLDEATMLEVISPPQDGQRIIEALNGTAWGKKIVEMFREMSKTNEPREVLLAIFRCGFCLGLRTLDLAVLRDRA